MNHGSRFGYCRYCQAAFRGWLRKMNCQNFGQLDLPVQEKLVAQPNPH